MIFANEAEGRSSAPRTGSRRRRSSSAGPRLLVLGEERVELPARRRRVVDTTGAGDALAAGFLVGGPELALEAAARCVAKLGAMP